MPRARRFLARLPASARTRFRSRPIRSGVKGAGRIRHRRGAGLFNECNQPRDGGHRRRAYVQMPATPEKVWQAISKAKKESSPMEAPKRRNPRCPCWLRDAGETGGLPLPRRRPTCPTASASRPCCCRFTTTSRSTRRISAATCATSWPCRASPPSPSTHLDRGRTSCTFDERAAKPSSNRGGRDRRQAADRQGRMGKR